MEPAVDRKTLAREQAVKTTKWPRTDRRVRRVRGALERRQPDLTVVLENVHDPHNVSAVLRSCDGVGILRVHTVYSLEEPPRKAFARTTSGSAAKWIQIARHASIDDCYAALRAEGFAIYATALHAESRQLYETDCTQPVAFVFGNEMRGVSDEAVEKADGSLYIPMQGMIESLNISVACAVTLYETMRQRMSAGHYDQPKLGPGQLDSLTEEWIRR